MQKSRGCFFCFSKLPLRSVTKNNNLHMSNISLFAQIIRNLDRGIFSQLVKEKGTDKYSKGFNSWSHLVSMLFCQFCQEPIFERYQQWLAFCHRQFKSPQCTICSLQIKSRLSELQTRLEAVPWLLLQALWTFRTAG